MGEEQNQENPPPSSEMTPMDEVKELRQEVIKLKKTISDMQNKSEEDLNQVLLEYAEKLSSVNLELAGMKETMLEALQRLGEQTQERLLFDIEISGVAELEHEDLETLVIKVAEKFGVQLDAAGIVEAKREGDNAGESAARPIMVTFLKKRKRDEILEAARQRRNVTTEDVVEGEVQPIFINERLTNRNSQLFHLAPDVVRNGHIYEYLRETLDGEEMVITERSDLDLVIKIPASEDDDLSDSTDGDYHMY